MIFCNKHSSIISIWWISKWSPRKIFDRHNQENNFSILWYITAVNSFAKKKLHFYFKWFEKSSVFMSSQNVLKYELESFCKPLFI